MDYPPVQDCSENGKRHPASRASAIPARAGGTADRALYWRELSCLLGPSESGPDEFQADSVQTVGARIDDDAAADHRRGGPDRAGRAAFVSLRHADPA